MSECGSLGVRVPLEQVTADYLSLDHNLTLLDSTLNTYFCSEITWPRIVAVSRSFKQFVALRIKITQPADTGLVVKDMGDGYSMMPQGLAIHSMPRLHKIPADMDVMYSDMDVMYGLLLLSPYAESEQVTLLNAVYFSDRQH